MHRPCTEAARPCQFQSRGTHQWPYSSRYTRREKQVGLAGSGKRECDRQQESRTFRHFQLRLGERANRLWALSKLTRPWLASIYTPYTICHHLASIHPNGFSFANSTSKSLTSLSPSRLSHLKQCQTALSPTPSRDSSTRTQRTEEQSSPSRGPTLRSSQATQDRVKAIAYRRDMHPKFSDCAFFIPLYPQLPLFHPTHH